MTKLGKYGVAAAIALLAGAAAPAAFAQANSSSNDNNAQVTGSQTPSGAPATVRGQAGAATNTGAQIGNGGVNVDTSTGVSAGATSGVKAGAGATSNGAHVQGDVNGGGAKTSGSNAN